eukprot:236942_1
MSSKDTICIERNMRPQTIPSHTCSSATDVTVAVADDTGSDISHTYCNYAGDDCGTCSNGASYAEHFTIPLYPALYYIEIAPWNTGGVYTLSIACTAAQISLPYNCQYYHTNDIDVHQSQHIIDFIHDRNATFELQFDIKLNDNCKFELCNILQISSEDHIAVLLSIHSMQNEFVLSLANNSVIYTILSANELLPVDGEFHRIYLSYGEKTS